MTINHVYHSRVKARCELRTIAVIMLLAAASVAQAEAAKSVELSDADEVRVGDFLAAKFVALEGLAPTPQIVKIETYLQSVVDKLAPHAQRKLPYKVHYDPDPTFKSAFALPGGHIFIGAGVLAMMDTEDQLAIVLAHEMEHVALNQCRERLAQQLTAQHLTLATADQMKVEPFFPGYGHDNEFAADYEGVKLASAATYSPQGAVRLLNMYIFLGQQMKNTPSEAEQNLKNRVLQIERLTAEKNLPTPKERPLAFP
jgi:beta-barrel assembly-enhancing protease